MRWPNAMRPGIWNFRPSPPPGAGWPPWPTMSPTTIDLHDGLRAGLFTEDDLMELPVTAPAFEEVDRLHPGLDPTRRRHEALRRVFGVMVEDVIAVAENRSRPAGRSRSRTSATWTGRSSASRSRFTRTSRRSSRFLFYRMYRAPSVVVERRRVTAMIRDLFPLFLKDPALLPAEWRADVAAARDETELARSRPRLCGRDDRPVRDPYDRLCGGGA